MQLNHQWWWYLCLQVLQETHTLRNWRNFCIRFRFSKQYECEISTAVVRRMTHVRNYRNGRVNRTAPKNLQLAPNLLLQTAFNQFFPLIPTEIAKLFPLLCIPSQSHVHNAFLSHPAWLIIHQNINESMNQNSRVETLTQERKVQFITSLLHNEGSTIHRGRGLVFIHGKHWVKMKIVHKKVTPIKSYPVKTLLGAASAGELTCAEGSVENGAGLVASRCCGGQHYRPGYQLALAEHFTICNKEPRDKAATLDDSQVRVLKVPA